MKHWTKEKQEKALEIARKKGIKIKADRIERERTEKVYEEKLSDPIRPAMPMP